MKNTSILFHVFAFLSFVFTSDRTNGQSLEWMSNLGSTVSVFGESMIPDESGHIYITGYFTGIADFDASTDEFLLESAGSNDVFVLKITEDGQFVWAKRFGGVDNDRAKKIELDSEGNILVCGYFSDLVDFDPGLGNEDVQATGNTDAFVIKLTSNGSFVWVNTAGSGSAEETMDIAIDSQNNIYCVGYFGDQTTFVVMGQDVIEPSAGFQDGFVMKTAPDGEVLWLETFGSTSFDQATSIFIDGNDVLYIGGYFTATVNFDFANTNLTLESLNSSYDVFVLKLSTNAEIDWGLSFQGDGSGDFITDVLASNEGSIHLCGYFDNNFDANPQGDEVVMSSEDGLAGFMVCLNSLGEYQWSKELDADNTVLCSGMNTNPNGNVMLYGRYQSTMEIGPGWEFESVTSNGAQDMFFIEYAEDGTMLDFFAQGGFGSETANGIYVNNEEEWFVMGTFGQQMDADPDDDELIVIPGAGINTLLQKLIECPVAEIYETDGTLFCDAAGVNYQWIDCLTDLFIDGETESSFTPQEDGLYYLYISNEFCEDYSGCLDVIVGIDETNTNGLHHAYFNQGTQEVVLSNSLREAIQRGETWLIIDSKGSLVSNGTQVKSGNINVASIDSGMFHLVIDNFCFRFVK